MKQYLQLTKNFTKVTGYILSLIPYTRPCRKCPYVLLFECKFILLWFRVLRDFDGKWLKVNLVKPNLKKLRGPVLTGAFSTKTEKWIPMTDVIASRPAVDTTAGA